MAIKTEQKNALKVAGLRVVEMFSVGKTAQEMIEIAYAVEDRTEREAMLFAVGNWLGYDRKCQEIEK